DLLRVAQGLGPRAQQLVTGRSQLVPAFRRSRLVGVPLGTDEPVLLQRAQDAVEAAHVGAFARDELGGALEQLVSVRRLLGEEEEKRRLEKALHPAADVPAAAAVAPAGPWAVFTCETHVTVERR